MVRGTSETCILQMKRPGEEFAQGHTGACVAGHRQGGIHVQHAPSTLSQGSPPLLGKWAQAFNLHYCWKEPQTPKGCFLLSCPAQRWCLESGRDDGKCPDVFLLGARQPHRAGLPEYSCGSSCVSWHNI